MNQANQTGVAAYLDAGTTGLPLYRKYGFKEVAPPLSIDLNHLGISSIFMIHKMAYYPSIKKDIESEALYKEH